MISLVMQQVQPTHDTLVTPHTVHEPGAIPSYHTSIPHTQSTPPCVTLPSLYTTQQHAHRVVYRMYLSRVSQPAFISHCDVLAGKLRLGLVYYHIRRSKTLGTQSRTQQAAAERGWRAGGPAWFVSVWCAGDRARCPGLLSFK